MNSHIPGVQRSRARLPHGLSHRGGARLGLFRHRHVPHVQRPGSRAARGYRGVGRAQKQYLDAHRGAQARLLLPHRARRRLRRVRHAHHRREERDKYVINGTKCFITNGSHAAWYTVYAKTDKEAGCRDLRLHRARDADGAVVDKKDKLGQRASDTAMISFNDVEIPADLPDRRGEQGLQARDDDARPHAPVATRC